MNDQGTSLRILEEACRGCIIINQVLSTHEPNAHCVMHHAVRRLNEATTAVGLLAVGAVSSSIVVGLGLVFSGSFTFLFYISESGQPAPTHTHPTHPTTPVSNAEPAF